MRLASQEVRDAWEGCAGRALASGHEWYRLSIIEPMAVLALNEPVSEFAEVKTYDFRIERRELRREYRCLIEVFCGGDLVWRGSEPL